MPQAEGMSPTECATTEAACKGSGQVSAVVENLTEKYQIPKLSLARWTVA